MVLFPALWGIKISLISFNGKRMLAISCKKVLKGSCRPRLFFTYRSLLWPLIRDTFSNFQRFSAAGKLNKKAGLLESFFEGLFFHQTKRKHKGIHKAVCRVPFIPKSLNGTFFCHLKKIRGSGWISKLIVIQSNQQEKLLLCFRPHG